MTEIRCEHCGLFQVSNSALEKMRDGTMEFDRRRAAL
jgi:hypothetical protein